MLKNCFKKKSAFTLIELIVTVIVVSIIASLAVINYRAILDRPKLAEAKSVLLHGYAGYQRLLFDNEPINGANRLSWSRMGISDAATMANRYFDYTIRPNTAGPTSLRATLIQDNSKYIEVSLSDGNLTIVSF